MSNSYVDLISQATAEAVLNFLIDTEFKLYSDILIEKLLEKDPDGEVSGNLLYELVLQSEEKSSANETLTENKQAIIENIIDKDKDGSVCFNALSLLAEHREDLYDEFGDRLIEAIKQKDKNGIYVDQLSIDGYADNDKNKITYGEHILEIFGECASAKQMQDLGDSIDFYLQIYGEEFAGTDETSCLDPAKIEHIVNNLKKYAKWAWFIIKNIESESSIKYYVKDGAHCKIEEERYIFFDENEWEIVISGKANNKKDILLLEINGGLQYILKRRRDEESNL